MARKKMIQVEGLSAGYGEVVILENISFEIPRGEITVIVGGSGCGKSTLLKHMIGLYPPQAGRIVIDGTDMADSTEQEYRSLLQRIGILYQGGALLGSMTVGQNIALPLLEYTDLDQEAIEAMVRLKLSMVHLDGYENHLPSEISGGMAKRAGLARAMALNPSILFFDEPSAGLDPITSADLDQLILRLNRIFNTTMIIVTHELRSIFTVADRAVMLDKSTRGIVAIGPPKDLRDKSENPLVRRFFNPELEAEQGNF